MMVLTILVVFIIVQTRRATRPRKIIEARNFAELPTVEPQESDADRQKRELAAADLERWQAMNDTYRRLLDALEAELKDCTDTHRRTAILSKIATTERKTHDLDRRIEKLYYTANAVKI